MPDAPNDHSSAPETGTISTDFRGSRRLVGKEEWFWYLAAAVSYILLGIWHKWLLNWFVGPVWLVVIIVAGPWLTDRMGITGRATGGGEQ